MLNGPPKMMSDLTAHKSLRLFAELFGLDASDSAIAAVEPFGLGAWVERHAKHFYSRYHCHAHRIIIEIYESTAS
jgi:hypothetical protein